MQVADLQDSGFPTPATYDYLGTLIKEEDPDLIVLTGDNISGGVGRESIESLARWHVKKAIGETMSFFETFNIPVAVVFGNHDAEGLISKEEQMQMYQGIPLVASKYYIHNLLHYISQEVLTF